MKVASAVAALGCAVVWALPGCFGSSSAGPSDGGVATETGQAADDSGSSEAAPTEASAGDAGADTGSDSSSPANVGTCGSLFSCCASLNDKPFIPGGVGPTSESACIAAASALQPDTCAANASVYEPGGTCQTAANGDAGPAACGPNCTALAGCCDKLSVPDPTMVPGCTALATRCTTGSESYCELVLEMLNGQVLSGLAHVGCP